MRSSHSSIRRRNSLYSNLLYNESVDSAALWEFALRTLGDRAQTSGELRRKLHQRAEHPEDVAEILQRLKESGYLNDAAFAESYAGNRHQFGKRRILNELRQRGVAQAVAAETVHKLFPDTDEPAQIEAYIRRKLKPEQNQFHEKKQLAAAYRKLLRAGFGAGNALRVLKQFANPK